MQSFLFEDSVHINDYIEVKIPTVNEVLENEEQYYGIVSSLVATPWDMMVQLDDLGIDFTEIDDYELFLITFQTIRVQDTHLIFGDLDLSGFEPAINDENQTIVLLDKNSGTVIDKSIHYMIAETLRRIHHLERNIKKPGNEEAKKFLIERARKKLMRQRRMKQTSQLEPLIIAMVNTEQFKYNYEETKALSIFQFNESVIQIVKKIDYMNKMHGVYSGTVNVKDLRQEDINWLTHK